MDAGIPLDARVGYLNPESRGEKSTKSDRGSSFLQASRGAAIQRAIAILPRLAYDRPVAAQPGFDDAIHPRFSEEAGQ
jgi:hypothetical protein